MDSTPPLIGDGFIDSLIQLIPLSPLVIITPHGMVDSPAGRGGTGAITPVTLTTWPWSMYKLVQRGSLVANFTECHRGYDFHAMCPEG